MKQILIAGLLALSTAASASVLAAPGDMGKFHERNMQRMSSELQLTEEQQQQMGTVHQEHLDKMKALHQEKDDKVGAILTDEQRSKWQEMREQRRQEMQKNMQERMDRKDGRDRKDRKDGQRGERNNPSNQ